MRRGQSSAVYRVTFAQRLNIKEREDTLGFEEFERGDVACRIKCVGMSGGARRLKDGRWWRRELGADL